MRPFEPSLEPPIVIHSPLYWDQPEEAAQQFLAKLSKRPVLLIEAPLPVLGIRASVAEARSIAGFPNVTVLRMQMPFERWTDNAWMSQRNAPG